jgi:dGTPase
MRKFGAYVEDADVFGWMRTGAQGARRCLEAQVMDLADDIAYSVHDVEDAVASGHVDLRVLAASHDLSAVFEVVRDWYLPDAADDELASALARLTALPSWPDEAHDGGLRSQARLKSLTSALIGRFCTTTQAATHAAYGSGRLTRYSADLVVLPETRAEIAVLKGIAAHYVMRRDDRIALLVGQRAALTELVERLVLRPDALEPLFAERYAAAGDDRARRRVVVDQVASLTDRSAVAWLQRPRA